MRCKNCPRTSKASYRKTAKCWKKWQLCGQCAVKLHPEEFTEAQIAGLLVALSTRCESIEEIAGAAKAMRNA